MQASMVDSARSMGARASSNFTEPSGDIKMSADGADGTLSSVSGLPTTTSPSLVNFTSYVDLHPETWSRITYDPDRCDLGLFQWGMRVRSRLLLDGEVIDETVRCMGGDGTFEYEVSLTQPGAHTVTVEMEFANSGTQFGSESRVVNVVEDYEDPGGTDPPEEGGSLLPCFLDPSRDCGSGSPFVWIAAGAGLFLILALVI